MANDRSMILRQYGEVDAVKLVLIAVAILVSIKTFNFLFSKVGINKTESVYFRLYIIDNNKNFNRNDYVLFKASKNYPFFIKKGEDIVKKVACISGDKLTVYDNKYYCNNVPIAEYKTIQSQFYGVFKPLYYHNYIIPKGYVFVVGDHYRSYDSRFWGLLNENDIVSTVTPIM